MKNQAKELYEKVIQNDYCIGCGTCAFIKDSPFKIKMDEFGNIIAYKEGNLEESEAPVFEICPFSEISKNEDIIGDIYFKDVENKDHRIGRYLANYAGYVTDDEFRSKGSSGGLGKWLGYTLLKDNKIDFFIQVVPNQTNDPSLPLFDYQVVSSKDEVIKGSKSSYYPVSLINILSIIKQKEARYAITGVPCFIKAIRLLSLHDETLNKRIKYTIGIICGGMKSANQSKMIGWEMGVRPENLISIDFRRKHVNKPASYKIYQVWSNLDDKERFRDSNDVYGNDWGAGYFKPNACDFCDDVVAETADISVGDAWLPDFVKDPKGTSIIIVRNKEILELIEKYSDKGALHLAKVTNEDVAVSQRGGLRHRREGLSYRLGLMEAQNKWYPPKRVKPNEFQVEKKRKYLYRIRGKISKQSHISFYNALQKNDLNVFFNEMKPLYSKYFNLIYGNKIVRAFKKIQKMVKG